MMDGLTLISWLLVFVMAVALVHVVNQLMVERNNKKYWKRSYWELEEKHIMLMDILNEDPLIIYEKTGNITPIHLHKAYRDNGFKA